MNRRNWLAAGIVGVLAALVYLGCLAGYAYPGESARLMAAWRGLAVAASPGHPLMGVLARLTGASNWLSAICGLIAVVTLFHLVAGYVAWCLQGEDADPRRRTLPLVAATVASVVFILTPAVLSAATHLEPRMFDFMWALLAFALALPLMRGPKALVWLYMALASAMVSFGLCDSALFLTFVPFYLATVAAVARKHGVSPYLPAGLFLILVIGVTFVALGVFGIDVSAFLRSLGGELKMYWTTPGWVFVAIFATLPFVTINCRILPRNAVTVSSAFGMNSNVSPSAV